MINQKLLAARKEKGWSIEIASARVGVSRVTYSRWENGHQEPQPNVLHMLCEAFNTSADDLGYGHLSKEPSRTLEKQKGLTQSIHIDQDSLVMLTKDQVAALLNLIGDDMQQFDSSKRATLQKLFGIAGAAFFSPFQDPAHIGKLLHNEEVLSICTTSIPIYWRLYFDGHLAEVISVLPGVLEQLSRLAERPSTYQTGAAGLASKAHQLACMIALQPQDFKSALTHADQAIQYARIAKDSNVYVASLIRKALVYFYLNRQNQRLWVYQEASQYMSNISLLLQGRVYGGLAEAHSSIAKHDASSENKHQALHFLELMYNTFPAHPKEDPNFSYTHFKLTQGYEGLIYLNLNQPGKAWDALTQMDKAVPASIVPDRVELTVRQARTLITLGDLQQGGFYLESAVNSANVLGSKLRYKESLNIYQEVLAKWPNERYARDLAELFPIGH